MVLKTTLAEKIDDRRAENWVALDDFKKQFKDLYRVSFLGGEELFDHRLVGVGADDGDSEA